MTLEEITRSIMSSRNCDWREARSIMGRAGARKREANRQRGERVAQHRERLERMGLG